MLEEQINVAEKKEDEVAKKAKRNVQPESMKHRTGEMNRSRILGKEDLDSEGDLRLMKLMV